MTIQNKKSYIVKQWFANKIAEELQQNITMCDVFAVIKETEKAIYAMLNIGTMKKKTIWVPKSALEEFEIGEDSNTGEFHHETYINSDYEEASKMFNDFWKKYM